jgi:hypothetical protein
MVVSNIDEIPSQYADALDAANTLQKLREVVRLYREVAIDAVEAADNLSQDDFADWQAALKKERRGRFMGEDAFKRFGAILAPAIMLDIAFMAHELKVPWGLAYNRLLETKQMIIKDGVAVLKLS